MRWRCSGPPERETVQMRRTQKMRCKWDVNESKWVEFMSTKKRRENGERLLGVEQVRASTGIVEARISELSGVRIGC